MGIVGVVASLLHNSLNWIDLRIKLKTQQVSELTRYVDVGEHRQVQYRNRWH